MNPHSFGARAPVIQGFFSGGRPPPVLQAHAGHGGRPGGRGHPPVAQPFGSGSAFQVPSTVRFAGRGSGQPLPAAVLQRMEEFFGTSFADVRVHVGPQAASIGALAFTMGADLYFAPGQYDPHSAHGQRLLGHELTHVVQQRAGRVRNPLGGGVAVVQDPALEAEAERMGTRMGAMPAGAAVQAGIPGAQMVASLAPRLSHGRGGASQSYRVQPPVQGPNGRMRIRATLRGSAGEAGSVNIRPTPAGLLEITDLYVAPEHRRRGVGSRLMQAVLRTSRNRGVGGAVLEARPSDAGISAPALQAMYERMGFQMVGMSAGGTPVMQFGTGAPGSKTNPVAEGAAHVVQRAEMRKGQQYSNGFMQVGHYEKPAPVAGMATHATLGIVLDDGDEIVLGAAKNLSKKGKHAEDVVVELLREISGSLKENATTEIHISVTKSPCSSTHNTSKKAKGCTEVLMELAGEKWPGGTPKYNVVVWVDHLYGGSEKRKKDSCAALQDLKKAGVTVTLENDRIVNGCNCAL
jgi:ribosomal protein S18 acetylase RimI-like enzyme